MVNWKSKLKFEILKSKFWNWNLKIKIEIWNSKIEILKSKLEKGDGLNGG